MSVLQRYKSPSCRLQLLFFNAVPFYLFTDFMYASVLLQIQNQLPGAIFPYVFYPVKLPKSITMDSGLLIIFNLTLGAVYLQYFRHIYDFYLCLTTEPKPLTDISIVTRTAGHSDISRIK